MTKSESSSSDSDHKRRKKKNKHDSDSSDETQTKKIDYKQIILEITPEENEYRRKLYPDFHRVLEDDITCTVCSRNLKKDVSLGKSMFCHPILKVLQCRKCSEVHNDSDCDGLACIWCKDDDSLFSCVSCTSQLCEDCIKKNLGKKALKDAEDDYWKCVLCNPRVLWRCRAKCWAALEEARHMRSKKNKIALNALVERLKEKPKRPVRKRAGAVANEDDAKSGSSAESIDSEGSSRNPSSIHTSEDSDVEDVYSSNCAEKERQCVKKRKPRKNRRSSRSFSENKGDETEDSESGADDKKNGGTPRSSLRHKNLKPLPKTNGMLASSTSDSSSEEDDARKRRELTGVEGAIEDVLCVGEMLVDQIDRIKKKFKSAALVEGTANTLTVKKLLNVVQIGLASLAKVEVDLKKCGENNDADPTEDICNASTQELLTTDQNADKSEGPEANGEDLPKLVIRLRRLSELMEPSETAGTNKFEESTEDMFAEDSESLLKDAKNDEDIPSLSLLANAPMADSAAEADDVSQSLLANAPHADCATKADKASPPHTTNPPNADSAAESDDVSPSPLADAPNADSATESEDASPSLLANVTNAAESDDVSSSLLANAPKSWMSSAEVTDADASPSPLASAPKSSVTAQKSEKTKSPAKVKVPRAASPQDEEFLAKKDLLDSSSDESEDFDLRPMKNARRRASSSSDWDEEPIRGQKRPAEDNNKSTKKQKVVVDVKNDAKLKADCYVDLKRMSDQDMEEYLSALQEHYLEEDDSRDRDREIERLGDLSTLRRKKRGNGSGDDDEENKSENRKKERNEKPKTKEKEKGLMEFLDEEESGEPNSSLDTMELDKGKSSLESGVNLWNNMNKEFLLQDSSDDDNVDGDNDVDLVKPKLEPYEELDAKPKAEPDTEPEIPDEEPDVKPKVKKEKEEPAESDKENGEEATSDKENTNNDSDDEESKKRKNWRRNRLLVGKLSDTDSDEGMAASQRKEERRKEMGSEEEEQKRKETKKDSKLSGIKKVRRQILKSDSDSDIKSTDKSSDDDTFAKKKKKKKVSKASDDSSEEEEVKKKPKRRRIKVQDSSSGSGDDQQNSEKTDTPNKGRKKIRKVFKDDDLVEETKEAAKIEEERRKRIAERQKMYDEMYEALQASATEGQNVDKLVLDFDEKTKTPLVEVHPKIVEKLKPHQVKGIKFMWDACYESLERIKKTKGSGCILAHCMGLGKTFQVVALCHTLLNNPECKTRRILVVSPLSTVLNWCNEFDKWLKGLDDDDDDEINVYNLTKQKKNYERQYQLKNWQETGGVMVLGYDMYRILSNPAGKGKVRASITKTFQETLVDPGPDLVICDEGHLLKNEATALARSMSRIKTMRRVVLTGTPLQNNLKEYHCMVQFVKPNLLGTRKEFLNRFVNPITNGQFEDSTAHDVKIMKRRAHVLHKMLEDSVQRFDYSVLTPFLPPKQEYVISIRVSELQEKLYRHYLEHVSKMTSGPDEDGRSTGKGATLFKDFQNLQRVWTHPLVLKWSSERQREERERRAESDSEGSLRDFIDDDEASGKSDTSSSSSSSLGDDVVCLNSDAEEKKKQKAAKTVARRTRSSKKDVSEEEVAEEIQKQPQNWWEEYVTEDHFDDLREGPKLVLLFSVLKECETLGEKVLVFSQSLYSLDLIEHFLEKVDNATQNNEDDEKLLSHRGSWTKTIDYFRLDGSTPTDIRAAWCKSFNKESNTRARLFLISTKAGGLGINLVAANRVILFDASWNPSHDVQSIFRVYRFGQKRPVFVYRFLAQGTMEEKIYERQVTKLSLAGRVVDEHQIERHYNMADLQELYRFTPSEGPRETPKLPKDRMFADLLQEHGERIVTYHEHDSLLQNKADEELNEEERKEAWEDYEKEKKGLSNVFGGPMPGMPAVPNQADILNAIKFTNPNMTDAEMKALLPTIMNDLNKIALNPLQAGQQFLALQQMAMRQQQQQQPKQMNLMPNYQPPQNLNYQQQQMYLYQQQQQQLRNAQQYLQRNAQAAPYQPSTNTAFVPLTNDNYRRAYGASFTNSMGFNQPNMANQASTSQIQPNRQPNTKVININTPSHK